MILADKIIINRKKLNMTQEDLAAEINVSRQAVSKWESAQSLPEMEKIILLSDLFGVSVDYLIRDEIEDIEYLDNDYLSRPRQLSLKEVNDFLDKNNKSSNYVSLGVMLCILSPITLITLTALAENGYKGLSENLASGLGVSILLILVSIAVALFILSSSFIKDYDFLEKEEFDLDYGVEGIVKQKQELRARKNTVNILIGVVLLIMSVIPVILVDSISTNSSANLISIVIMFFTISVAVFILVRNGIKASAYSKILQEKDYSIEKKASSETYGKVAGIYWLTVLTVFLAYSFIYNAWSNSWIIWPIAAVLFPLIMLIVSILIKDK